MKKRRTKVVDVAGNKLGFKLVIPSSIGPNMTFLIGEVRFRNYAHYTTALDPLPKSWFYNK